MSFTYIGDLSTDRDKIRFNLQDVTASSGPRPSGGNFSDAELDGLLTLEGSWQRAVCAGFEALAAQWMRYANYTIGPRSEQVGAIAKNYADQATTWRARWGYGQTATGAGSSAVTRVDAYSDDVAADAVSGVGSSEYEKPKWYVEYGE